MTESLPLSGPLPPRLSMDQYADFVEAFLRDVDPALAARQKGLEKRVRTPFRMGNDTPESLPLPPPSNLSA